MIGSKTYGARLRRLGQAGRMALAFASATLLLGSAGCGGDESPAPEAASPDAGPTAANTPQIAVPKKPKAPMVPGEARSGEIPEGFPEDLPIPPNTTPQNSLMVPGQIGMVTFVSEGSTEEVSQYFTEQLPGQGWSVDAPVREATRTMIRARKGGRIANVAISSVGGEGTQIAITVEGS